MGHLKAIVDEEEKEEWVESIWLYRELMCLLKKEWSKWMGINRKEKEVVNDMEEEVIER